MAWIARLVVLCLLGFGTLAHADDKAVAKKAFREGSAQYDLGNYAAALEQFKKAYLHFEDPSILYNMAQCQRQLGDRAEAVKLYRSYLRNLPQAPNRAAVEATLSQLDKEVADEAAAKEKEKERLEKERLAREDAAWAAANMPRAVASVPAPRAKKTPVYKKWWLWTAVGGAAVAVGLGVGLGVGLTRTAHFDNTLSPLGPGTSTHALVSF
jgi:tetratricopeptide (TPR) repeat protein